MAGHESKRVILTALAANVGIAVAKFAAAAVTGSSAMLTEGVHSLVDSIAARRDAGRADSARAPPSMPA